MPCPRTTAEYLPSLLPPSRGPEIITEKGVISLAKLGLGGEALPPWSCWCGLRDLEGLPVLVRSTRGGIPRSTSAPSPIVLAEKKPGRCDNMGIWLPGLSAVISPTQRGIPGRTPPTAAGVRPPSWVVAGWVLHGAAYVRDSRAPACTSAHTLGVGQGVRVRAPVSVRACEGTPARACMRVFLRVCA